MPLFRSPFARPAPAWLLALAMVLPMSGPAQARMFSDPALDQLYAAQRWDELLQAARQRPADDPQAVLALAVDALRQGDAPRRAAAIAAAQACVDKRPEAAPCQYGLGAVLGVQAASEGMMKMIGSVGRIRGALQAALDAAPDWYPARSAMVEFYLAAPGIAGGSKSKAQELARAAPRPEQARALQARLLMHDDKYEEALQLLSPLQAGADSALASDAQSWGNGAAFRLVSTGAHERARGHFERLRRERPQEAMGAYGLARVAAAAGDHARALQDYEASRKGAGAERLPIDYRAGLSLLAMGQRDAARASLQRFVDAGKGPRSNLDDARKQLEKLAGG